MRDIFSWCMYVCMYVSVALRWFPTCCSSFASPQPWRSGMSRLSGLKRAFRTRVATCGVLQWASLYLSSTFKPASTCMARPNICMWHEVWCGYIFCMEWYVFQSRSRQQSLLAGITWLILHAGYTPFNIHDPAVTRNVIDCSVDSGFKSSFWISCLWLHTRYFH